MEECDFSSPTPFLLNKSILCQFHAHLQCALISSTHCLLISPSCSWHPLPVPFRNLSLLFGDLLAFTGVNGMTIVWNLKSFLEMGTKNSNKKSSLCPAISFTFKICKELFREGKKWVRKNEIINLNFKAPVNYLCVGASTGLESMLVFPLEQKQ